MKYEMLPLEGLTLEKLLRSAAAKKVIFLTRHRKVRFALMHADDGDQEVLLLRSNNEFMAYLTEATKRAMAGPTKSLEQVRREFGLDEPKRNSKNGKRALSRR